MTNTDAELNALLAEWKQAVMTETDGNMREYLSSLGDVLTKRFNAIDKRLSNLENDVSDN
jgi:hypothetical protein